MLTVIFLHPSQSSHLEALQMKLFSQKSEQTREITKHSNFYLCYFLLSFLCIFTLSYKLLFIFYVSQQYSDPSYRQLFFLSYIFMSLENACPRNWQDPV